MLKHLLFLWIFFIGLGSGTFGQQPFDYSNLIASKPNLTSSPFSQNIKWDAPYTSRIALLPSSSFNTIPFLASKTEKIVPPILFQATTPLPAAFDYEELAVFCKLEYKMEKAFKFPVKIRLGEVQYTERREGKE